MKTITVQQLNVLLRPQRFNCWWMGLYLKGVEKSNPNETSGLCEAVWRCMHAVLSLGLRIATTSQGTSVYFSTVRLLGITSRTSF